MRPYRAWKAPAVLVISRQGGQVENRNSTEQATHVDSPPGQREGYKMTPDPSLCGSSLFLQGWQNPGGTALVFSSRNILEGNPGAYQDLRFHSWPVDKVVLLVDHDRFGDGGHARASWRLWAWAKCLQGLV